MSPLGLSRRAVASQGINEQITNIQPANWLTNEKALATVGQSTDHPPTERPAEKSPIANDSTANNLAAEGPLPENLTSVGLTVESSTP